MKLSSSERRHSASQGSGRAIFRRELIGDATDRLKHWGGVVYMSCDNYVGERTRWFQYGIQK